MNVFQRVIVKVIWAVIIGILRLHVHTLIDPIIVQWRVSLPCGAVLGRDDVLDGQRNGLGQSSRLGGANDKVWDRDKLCM